MIIDVGCRMFNVDVLRAVSQYSETGVMHAVHPRALATVNVYQ